MGGWVGEVVGEPGCSGEAAAAVQWACQGAGMAGRSAWEHTIPLERRALTTPGHLQAGRPAHLAAQQVARLLAHRAGVAPAALAHLRAGNTQADRGSQSRWGAALLSHPYQQCEQPRKERTRLTNWYAGRHNKALACSSVATVSTDPGPRAGGNGSLPMAFRMTRMPSAAAGRGRVECCEQAWGWQAVLDATDRQEHTFASVRRRNGSWLD